MSRQTRIRLVIAAVAIFAGVIFVVDFARQKDAAPLPPAEAVTSLPGTIALYQDGRIVAFVTPASLDGLEEHSFEDTEEGKRQSGPLLRDVILLYVHESDLTGSTRITVSSSAREKSVVLTWAQVANPDHHVLFDPSSNRGTLKLVSSNLDTLDTRAEWIQDTDRIEIVSQ